MQKSSHTAAGNVPQQPWTASGEWNEANRSLAALISSRGRTLAAIRELALTLKDLLNELGERFEAIGAATCGHCPHPCCATARPWFDFRDLLFIHLTGQAFPEGQPLEIDSTICRYLGPKGCRLIRLQRPWICTWYVCPTQTVRMRRQDLRLKERMTQLVQETKGIRIEMEDRFVEAVVSHPASRRGSFLR